MKEIIINYAPQETRIAITEDGALVEFLIERKREKGIAGVAVVLRRPLTEGTDDADIPDYSRSGEAGKIRCRDVEGT